MSQEFATSCEEKARAYRAALSARRRDDKAEGRPKFKGEVTWESGGDEDSDDLDQGKCVLSKSDSSKNSL